MARERAFGAIASTVCLPVVEHGRAVLNIDLYASTAHAFRDRIDGLVEALGAWQAGAVTNADLGFETLRRARARARDGSASSASSTWPSAWSRRGWPSPPTWRQ